MGSKLKKSKKTKKPKKEVRMQEVAGQARGSCEPAIEKKSREIPAFIEGIQGAMQEAHSLTNMLAENLEAVTGKTPDNGPVPNMEAKTPLGASLASIQNSTRDLCRTLSAILEASQL